MTTKHRPEAPCLADAGASRAIGRTERDRTFRDAFLAMRPLMKRGEHGRHIFDDVARGRACWLQIADAMETAARHGVGAENLAQFGRSLEAYAYQLTGPAAPLRPLSVVLMEEASLDAAADVAQVAALVDQSPSHLHEVITTADRHIAHLRELTLTCRRALLQPTNQPVRRYGAPGYNVTAF